MYKVLYLGFVILLAVGIVFSCSQNPTIMDVSTDITNYTTNFVNISQTNTNLTIFTNTNYITNTNTNNVVHTNYQTNYVNETNYTDNISTNVFFSILNLSEGSIIQPFFRLEGVLNNGFTISDVSNIYIYITNNNLTNYASFTSQTNFYSIISAQGYDKVYLYITLNSKLNSSYTVGYNVFISNIPTVLITNISSNFVPTFGDISFIGYSEISDPDGITNISIIISNSSGVFTNTPTTNLSSSWTNVVRRVSFEGTPSLVGGYNYVRVMVVSSSGIVKESDTITILKSLFVIDGNYDTLWNNAKLVASANNVNPYFGYGIGSMRVTNDGYFLYIFVSNLSVSNLGDNGLKLSISIDTNSTTGISNDAWVGTNQPGRFVYQPTNNNFPDIQIHIRLKQTNQVNGAGVYLANISSYSWTNVANTWAPGYQNGCIFGVNNSIGWEMAIPLSLVGIGNGTVSRFIAVLGKPDGDDKNSAIHILPESPSNEITTNDGYFTNIIRVWSSDYTISY